MIKYNIDTTEKEYINYSGITDDILEIKKIIYNNGTFTDCVGTIELDDNVKLWIASVKENGVYLRYEAGKDSYLSLNNVNQTEEIDVWGDGLFISEGFFISPELAWKGIVEFVNNAGLCEEITWIDCDDVSEELIFI